ncbi:MAG: nucleoside deaminase [Chloroflexota bacterium]|nr:MAG: nucleoside deaminase [Chloroflexota bacterium]
MPNIDREALVRACMVIAAEAGRRSDPPFGAVLVAPGGVILARAANSQASGADPTAHAEINLLRTAAPAGHLPPLRGTTIVVNAEPCSMCASAIVKAEVGEVIYGAPHEPHMDPDLSLADVLARSRRPPIVIGGVLAAECAAQIATFRALVPPPD